MRLDRWLPRFLKAPRPAEAAQEDDELAIYPAGSAPPVVIVTVFAVKPELLAEIVTVMQRRFQPAHRLLFITDSLDFSVFRDNGVIFEYLPSTLEQRIHADAMDWPAYLTERWALLLAKWRPLHVIAYGQNSDAFIASAPARTTPP